MAKHSVVLAQMIQKEQISWPPKQKHTDKRLLRNTTFLAAVSLCLGIYACFSMFEPKKTQSVMSYLDAGFEYDETLGKLQLVNNMLPASAMVFLNNNSSANQEFQVPALAQMSHNWTPQEPWFEYACIGDISACQSGEIMTIVRNASGLHTLRILHPDGYESIYSGLQAVQVKERDSVFKGQVIGTSAGNAAFELRRDGVSVLPVFSEI